MTHSAHPTVQPVCAWRTAVALLLSLSAATAGNGQPAPERDVCAWSPVWQEVMAPFKGLGNPEMTLTEPRRIKGSLKRPRSQVRRVIEGTWVVDAVVDEKGNVRDVKIVRTPRIDPPWPEYEAEVLKAIRQWRYTPPLRDGKPWPIFMTITAQDK